MEKFKFRFSAVLKIRKSYEDAALRSLSIAQKHYLNEIEKKEKLKQVLQQALVRREEIGKVPVPASSIYVEHDYIKGTKYRLIQSDQAILKAKRGADKALRFYLNAKRQTKAIEILYEKSLAEYKKNLSRAEQKKLDDMIMMRTRMSGMREDIE